MPAFIRERFARDIAANASSRGNVDIPGIVSAWGKDPDWIREAAGVADDDLAGALGDLGAEAYSRDAGNYATELRAATRELDRWWPGEVREGFLQAHTMLLFRSAADPVAMVRYREAASSVPVDLHGEAMLAAGSARGRGILLLGVNQGHPGPLVFHPVLAGFEIGVVQHTPGARAPVPLTPDGRVRLLPATMVGCRHALDLLRRKQCVLVANDYVFGNIRTIPSRLFGRPVLLSRALVGLARRSGAMVVPVSYERSLQRQRRYAVHLFPDLPTHEDGSAPGRLAHDLGLVTEALVRRSPENWRLWNTLPERWQTAGAAP